MIPDLSFGPPVEKEKKPKVDTERLERLIGVVTKKGSDSETKYLIGLTFEELDDLVYFLDENALDSEKSIQRIKGRLQNKITLIEKRS